MKRIKIALQAKGRLNEYSQPLLEYLKINRSKENRNLVSCSEVYPIDILWLRDDDITAIVNNGACDFGIVGQNLLSEFYKQTENISVLSELGFSKCRLSFAIKADDEWTGLRYLQGKRIATSYTNFLSKFLSYNGIDSKIIPMTGSVEIAPMVGFADVILDLVQTGQSLKNNGLKETEILFQSQAVLIGNKNIPYKRKKIVTEMINKTMKQM